MILPAQEIRRRCASSAPMISPFVERDVVRGRSFGLSAASYDIRIAQDLTIHPDEFRRASTMDRFIIANDVLIVVHDKSSTGRRALSLLKTIVKPDLHGYVTHDHSYHTK